MSAPKKTKEIVLPRGVKIRDFATERRLQIAFSYRGEECRELLPPQTITQTAANMAGSLRHEIQRKIAEGTFHYAD